MRGKKVVTLLSLLVLLMLVSGEEELIRVKRLHNEGPALSSKHIIHPPSKPALSGEEIRRQTNKEHPIPVLSLTHDGPFTKASPDTQDAASATRNPSKPASMNTIGGTMKRRMRRMAEDASLLKRSIVHHLLGGSDDAAVIDGERLKREKRPVVMMNRRSRRTR